MKQLLQKLLEAEILTPETKTELETAFQTQLDEAMEDARQETSADVRAELTEQWITDRETMVEAVDAKVDEFLGQEMTELREDIERFRDLEAEYAENLIAERSNLKTELDGDLKTLVEKIDTFLQIRLTSEIDELREDIDVVKQNEFGRKIFEAYADEFVNSYADEESAEASLRETEEELNKTQEVLEGVQRELATRDRDTKMSSILAPLDGKPREVMEAILVNVETEKLEEGYATFIGRVIRDSDDKVSEKEGKVLAEDKTPDVVKDVVVETAVTGDTPEVIMEDTNTTDDLDQLRRLAGIL